MEMPLGSVWETDVGSDIWSLFVVVHVEETRRRALVLDCGRNRSLSRPGDTFGFETQWPFARRAKRVA